MGGHFGFVSFDWSGVTVLGLYFFFPISLILPKDKKKKKNYVINQTFKFQVIVI